MKTEEKKLSQKWIDWNYVGENCKNRKQSMKRRVAIHFTRAIYVKENPELNLLSSSEKVKIKIHLVSMIPSVWRNIMYHMRLKY